MPVIDSDKKVVKMPYIYYPVRFQEEQVKTLLDNSREVNTMNPNFARKLDFKVWKTNVEAQKIDGSVLEIFGIIIANFQIEDKVNKPRFF